VQVNIVARQIGSLVPDWSLRVNLPALPAIGH
jgi:hypothetical protein